MGHHRYMSTVVATLVQHRYSTDTALDTNWIIVEMNNYATMKWLLMIKGAEFGGYKGPGSWGLSL